MSVESRARRPESRRGTLFLSAPRVRLSGLPGPLGGGAGRLGPAVVRSLLGEAELDGRGCLERVQSAEIGSWTNRTKLAIDRGVFGVPTVFVGEEMFWGNDRFELARYYIEKQRTG